MMTATPTWQDLFGEQRHALLGQRAQARRNDPVRSLADDEILLVGGASDAVRLSQRPKANQGKPPRSVGLTPSGPAQTLVDFRVSVAEMRQAYPGAELAGFGPLAATPAERFAGLDRGLVLAGTAAASFAASPELSSLAALALPLTAVLVYTPEVTAEAMEQAVKALGALEPVGVVALPAGAGDRIPLAGLTTAGSTDAMVVAALRILLPTRVRVRASWAALGWKVAQVAIAYGADEIAGWTAAETLAYTGRVRAASRVERQELDEGLEEARVRDAGWPTYSSGGSR
jgi:hypothetical protein